MGEDKFPEGEVIWLVWFWAHVYTHGVQSTSKLD